ncbi:MAG: 30S ribosomal protein S6 [Candidatus Humimicrobiaceae bacterium]
MRNYELALVFDPTLEETDIDAEISKLTSLMEKENCKVGDIDKWGVKKLAYPINNNESGYYSFIYFSGDGKLLPELERISEINDKVLRHLIVKKEE